MSEPTRKSDIIENDVFKNFIEELKLTEGLLIKYDAALTKTAQTMKNEFDTANSKTIEGMQKISKLQQQAENEVKKKRANQKSLHVLQKEMLKLDGQVKKAEAQKIAAYSKENKELIKLRHEKNKINKVTKDEIKQAERNTNAYTKLSDASRRYKNESKTLGAELLELERAGKKNGKAFKELNQRYTSVTNKAKTTDAQLKKLDNTVGDNQRSVGNYAKATRGLSRALGTLGVAVGVGQIFRKVGGIVSNYNQAVTDLGAISGKTADELEPLNDQARQLGATTQFSASEVTGLQIELAKLGFTTQEIMDSTGGIANFAAATGVEIPRAAALAGSALRAFGLDATEIDRVVSTLGVATTKTGLDFAKLENGLSTVAPVAASFGFSIEDTTALLGQLANSGFDASSAATATRNILLNLADANGDLAKQLGRPIKSADDLAGGLAELQAKGIDLASALELTDKRSVAAFSTFIKGSGDLVGLRDSITDVNDELTEMADKRLKSVQGAMKLLSSAFEEQVLGFNDATGASDKFQSSIKFIAENLGTIFSIIGKVVTSLLVYKAVMIAVNIRQSLAGKSAKQLGRDFLNLGKNAKGAAGESSKMGKTLRGVGWAALIGVAIELATAFYDIASGAARARYEGELYDEALRKATTKTNEKIQETNDLLDNQLKKIQRRKELGELTEQQALVEAQAAVETAKTVIDEEENKTDSTRKEIENRLKIFKEGAKVLKQNQSGIISPTAFSDISNYFGGALETLGVKDLINEISKMEAELKALDESSGSYTDQQDALNEKLAEFGHQLKVVDKEDNANKIKARVKGLKEETEQLQRKRLTLDEINDALNQGRTLEDIESEEIQQENNRIQRSLNERLTMINDAQRLGELSKEDAADQRVLAELDALNEQKRILELYGEDTVEIEKAISEKRLEVQEMFGEEQKDKTEEQQKEALKMINDTQKAITAAIASNIDERISLQEKEAQAASEQQDYLKSLAANGNIEAQQSITEERERELEALREKERLEKQKATLQLISSGLEVFSTELENGANPAEALATTVTTTGALTEFLAGLSFFAKGTDNAPEGAAVVDEKGKEAIFDKKGKLKEIGGKDARLTHLDAGDKVMTSQKTSEWLRQSAMMNELSPIKKDDAGSSYDLMKKDLQEITRAIKNQPSNDYNIEGIAKGVIEIMKSNTSGGDKRVSKYRVKY
jgi:TP901 family phage tail tape measure protein